MKRTLFTLALAMIVASPAIAEETMTTTPTKGAIRAGVDFAMPYTLRVDGANSRNRANLNVGIDGRYYYTDNMNFGVRFAFDVEKRTASNRQIGLMPGVQYVWMPHERFNPFVRADLPVTLKGAPNTSGSANKQDVGLAGGVGLGWNLGDAIGVQNMSIRYDFAMNYYFGLGSAVSVLALDIFKIGFDYRF